TDLSWNVAGAGDFNGDGIADVLWRHAVSGSNVIWKMSSSGTITQKVYPGDLTDLNWYVAGTGDLNADGTKDILWRHATNGSNVFWIMSGGGISTKVYPPTQYTLDWLP